LEVYDDFRASVIRCGHQQSLVNGVLEYIKNERRSNLSILEIDPRQTRQNILELLRSLKDCYTRGTDSAMIVRILIAEIIAISSYIKPLPERRDFQHEAILLLAKYDRSILEEYQPDKMYKYESFDIPSPNRYDTHIYLAIRRGWNVLKDIFMAISQMYGISPTLDEIIREDMVGESFGNLGSYMLLIDYIQNITIATENSNTSKSLERLWKNRIHIWNLLCDIVTEEDSDITEMPNLVIVAESDIILITDTSRRKRRAEFVKHYFRREWRVLIYILDLMVTTRPIIYYGIAYSIYRELLAIVLAHVLICNVNIHFSQTCAEMLRISVNLIQYGPCDRSRLDAEKLVDLLAHLPDHIAGGIVYTSGVANQIDVVNPAKTSVVRCRLDRTFVDMFESGTFERVLQRSVLGEFRMPIDINLRYSMQILHTVDPDELAAIPEPVSDENLVWQDIKWLWSS
jgi:hypothetical protein